MTSKFKGILQQARDREPAAETEVVAPPSPAPAPPPVQKKRGRPSGKRSDTEYVQITAYVREATHRDVKIALLKSRSKQDFSELVDSLLTEWLKTNI